MVSFTAAIEPRPRGGVRIRLPFDPVAEWGERTAYHLTGTVGGCRFRAAVGASPDERHMDLGPTWVRDAHLGDADVVDVAVELEGPQFATLAPDLRDAIGPEAARFFDELPTHYRLNFTRWVDEAKRADTRGRRVAATAEALRAGRRER